jgi:nicotinate-nucleotide adenylyltransferase
MKIDGCTVIYGGSFNPPHMGHQMACLYLLEALGAAAVWLMPAARHPFGKELVPFEHRVAMCQIVARAFGERAQVVEIEAQRGASGRTYDSLAALRQQHPGVRFGLAVGSDILSETPAWHRWDDITDLVPVVVLARAGFPEPEATPVALPMLASRDLRRLLRERESIEGLVPSGVAAYIERHNLYRS